MSTSRGTRWRICFWTHRHAMRIRLPAMLCGRDCPCLLAQVSLLRRVSPRVCSRLSMCQNSSPIPLRTIRRPPFSWLKIQRGLRSSAKKLRVTVPPPHCSMAEFLRAIWSERSSICLSDIKRPYPPNIFPFNRSAWHKTGLPSNTPDSQNCTVFPAFLLSCFSASCTAQWQMARTAAEISAARVSAKRYGAAFAQYANQFEAAHPSFGRFMLDKHWSHARRSRGSGARFSTGIAPAASLG